jgi:hypothetical protein
MTPLWSSTPTTLPHVGRPSNSQGSSPSRELGSMADVLDEIVATPSQGYRQSFTPSPRSRHLNQQYSPPNGSGHSIQSSRTRTKPLALQRPNSPLSDITISSKFGTQPFLGQSSAALNQEEMDWSPSQPTSIHRAFDSRNSTQRGIQSFGQTPIVPQPSPFWFKVPPAPTTPAQQLRNPPNQPRLRVASHEVKENFFNNVTARKGDRPAGNTIFHENGNGHQRQEMEISQQRFFLPAPPNEAGNALADMMTSFSLGSTEDAPKIKIEKAKTRQFLQGLALAAALVIWNQTLPDSTGYYKNLAIMIFCLLLGTRKILDNAANAAELKKNTIALSLGACCGGLESVAAIYGIVEILAGRGEGGNATSLGSILLGGMLLHELWVGLLG